MPRETRLTVDQQSLATVLRNFHETIWPVYQRHGWKNIEGAFQNHLVLQSLSSSKKKITLPDSVALGG